MTMVIQMIGRSVTIEEARRRYPNIPEGTMDNLFRYATKHYPPGGFLRAVLENNLKESFGQADLDNTLAMRDIVSFAYCCLPAGCWGSPKAVNAWLTPE